MKNKIILVSSIAILASIPFFGKNQGFVGVFAEELIDIGDEVRMPTMTFYGDTSSEMAFTWNTTNYTDSDIQIAKKTQGNFDELVDYEITSSIEKSLVNNDGFIHRVIVSGLEADTEYIYRIGDIELGAFAESGSFKTTSNTNKDFKFIHVSDPQGWEEYHYAAYQQVLGLATMSNPSFFALTGDIVNNSWIDHQPRLQQWEWALTDQWNIFKDYPVIPVSGNHEEAANDFHMRFTLNSPIDSETISGDYYSLDYEGVHFSCLNTNDTLNKESEEATGLSEAQMMWLENDLAAHKDDRFKIVLMHKGIFDAGSHCANVAEGKDYDIDQIRKQLTPLFNEYHVDLVLQGHDHLYSLSYPIVSTSDGDDVDKGYIMEEAQYGEEVIRTFYNVSGTFYLNSGTASGSKYYASIGQENKYHIMESENPETCLFSEIEIKDKLLIVKTYKVIGNKKVLAHSFAIDKNKKDDPVPPSPEPKKGCGGNIYTCSTVLALLSALGITILIYKKKRGY